jgi:cysteine desulfuration protein SufE
MPNYPNELQQVIEDFNDLSVKDRLSLLLEYSDNLPELPQRYSDHPDLFERVEECQSPIFLFVEVDPDRKVHLFFSAPKEAPTTRGFAGILAEGLDGQNADTILAVDDDFANQLGLAEAVSPLRLRGMRAMLYRIKRQISEKLL